jgi:5,10-methenyltetrahydrofolate synthetase
MTRGVWSIPVPTQKAVVKPDVVIAPIVGFHACWRLGYGGGYFDRTLAAREPRPAAIGIGFEIMEIPGFRPQPHDIPMQTVVTESRIIECRRDLVCSDTQ